ncbi:IclR family transcriptional regulator domain-containing protein [Streptomyces aidingensis]|uniref:DNA-binding transcriptional regulator, IclR family n=1 Tax=Streptomyces aidingensis TaxID=910347 RepID=A0A1I1RH29_9ACTN|nr:IclR family transcriptional regulator C-terminal domain-containing protein [Streptomyces aidingensis]SFD33611.1 DNA-binding transcriptional regulator, IclR family [Streptomyces aidingensis]
MSLSSGLTTPFYPVQYALRLLEAAAGRGDGIREDELARQTGMPPGRLVPLLAMLAGEDYLRRLDDGSWTAGDALRLLGTAASRPQDREARLRRALDRLRADLGAAVYLGRYQDGELAIPHISAAPETPAVHQWVDFRAAAHATAIGKCLLNQLDHDGRRDHLARHRTARLTSRTITDERVLMTALDRQPATVPVLDLQEYAVGTLCAAVPLTAGNWVGCLALSLPVTEAHRLRRAAETLGHKVAPALLPLIL